MLDGTPIRRHFSDIVSASATKSKSEVELIDPFQLTDWRDKTPPELIYPKFKLFLENFKKNIDKDENKVKENKENTARDQESPEKEKETRDQKVQKATKKKYPTGIDTLLKRIMDPALKPEAIKIPENLSQEKRLKNKRKSSQDKKAPKKPRYQVPKQINTMVEQREIETNKEPDKQGETADGSNISQLRQSRRVPKLSAKYLESIQNGDQNLD